MAVNIRIGVSSFAALRRDGYYYVDKTGALETFLAKGPAMVTLFTRPRRFGKSLTMSMMAEFFDITKQSGDLFNGLRIFENRALRDRWMNQYPVLFMSFKEIAGRHFEAALSRFRTVIRNTCKQLGYLRESDKVFKEDRDRLIAISDRKADDSELHNDLVTLTSALATHHGKPVILLIDEYDVPVANAWKNGYYEEMIEFMRGFLGAVLKDSNSLTFAVLTGCMRITKESIFTGLNNLACYGVGDERYADMFGFTGDEVDSLLVGAGLSDRKDIVREWYNGYCFGTNQNIYCPWSILRYVDYAQDFPTAAPEAWWVNTSANELTRDFVVRLASDKVSGRSALDAPSARNTRKTFDEVQGRLPLLWAGMSIAATLNETPGYETLYDDEDNFWTLLYMTGYLTKARETTPCVDTPGEGETMLAIPNREVREAFKKEIDVWFRRALPDDPDEYFQAFWEADAGRFETLLTGALLHSASFHDTRNETPLAGEERRETFYHGTLLGLFIRSRYALLSNREEGGGRFDLSVADRGASRVAIIEVKKTSRIDDLDSAAQKGLEQIANRGYDWRLREEGYRTILHWSMAFCRKQCRARARLIDNS